MWLEHRFTCLLPNGLHARPASHLEAVASRFKAAAVLCNERNGGEANIKSVLALIGADIRCGDPLRLWVEGVDGAAAFDALRKFIEEDFAATDGALPGPVAEAGGRALPPSLRACQPVPLLQGTAVCGGLAEGAIVPVAGLNLAPGIAETSPGSPDAERTRYERAFAAVRARLETAITGAQNTEAEVLKAHLSLLRDASLGETVAELLASGSVNAALAILSAVEKFSGDLQRSDSVYLRERVLDLQDIGASLLAEIYGAGAVQRTPALTAPAIIVADRLTPGQFLALDRQHVRGLLLQHAGTTSHTVILARAAGIPTLIGVVDATALSVGQFAILDASLGVLLPSPNEAVRRYYALEKRKRARTEAAAAVFRQRPAISRDGQPLSVLANVSSSAAVAEAMAGGAEGVGLFRTETLFMNRRTPPSEDEQAAVYIAAVEAARGRPVTLRTFDIGGDKLVPYLNLPAEGNPFLGKRGARLYNEFPALLQTQLRAAFRAAAHGPVKIMAPMIACPEEMRAFRAATEAARAGFPQAADVPVGTMLEIPSAIFAIRELARDADFFSLGTNDLAQYFLAADRDNASVADLYEGIYPSFLRLLRFAVEQAVAHRRPIGLCGELGENTAALPLLLGLGLDSVSLASPRVLATKAALSRLQAAACRALLVEACDGAGRREVGQRLHQFGAVDAGLPLLSRDTVVVDAASTTKHEAIKELTDLLAVAGRVADGVAVEEAVWTREAAYSTGFGHGFAVPHCKSEQVSANSLALLRLRRPVDWGSLDGQPVRVVILLALCATAHGKEHLRIFSRLSRLVMQDAFRNLIERADDEARVFAVLNEALQLPDA